MKQGKHTVIVSVSEFSPIREYVPHWVAKVMSSSHPGLCTDDLVPLMHRIADRTAANNSLHLGQLITTEYS